MTTSRSISRRKKKAAKKELKQKMNMFNRLPDECSSCLTAFDKKNREMVQTWSVVVREQEKKVRLYCPTCWDTARAVIEKFEKEQRDNNDAQ
tara:strand:- start:947 stop:1222 length:276 start_codon:yes stop_codon:yes gene_type:complete